MAIRWVGYFLCCLVWSGVNFPLVNGFVPLSAVSTPSPILSGGVRTRPTKTANVVVYQSNSPKDYSATGRGLPIFLASLLFCTWLFTIPPEIRRTHICVGPCIENRDIWFCSECKTIGELKEEVSEYYRNGGGIEWDFSIDPNSKW